MSLVTVSGGTIEKASDGKLAVKVIVKNSNAQPVFTAPSLSAPVITNLSLPTLNTEVDHTLQTNLRKLRVKNQGNGRLQFSFVDTESGTKFITIPPGSEYIEDGLNLAAGTLHIQSNKNNQTVEILEWA